MDWQGWDWQARLFEPLGRVVSAGLGIELSGQMILLLTLGLYAGLHVAAARLRRRAAGSRSAASPAPEDQRDVAAGSSDPRTA